MNGQVSVIIVNMNTKKLLLRCINSLRSVTKSDVCREIIIVDNGSSDGSIKALHELDTKVNVVEMRRNTGYSYANNEGMKIATGRYWLLLNPDTYFTQDFLTPMVKYIEQESSVGMIGCALTYETGYPQEAGGYFDEKLLNLPTEMDSSIDPLSIHSVIDLDWIKGACLLLRAKMCHQIGLFDPRFFVNFETVDLSFRAKEMGWRVVYMPNVSIVHLAFRGSFTEWSRLRKEHLRSRQLLHLKHLGRFEYCYHSALTCLNLMTYIILMVVASKWPFRWPRYFRSLVAERFRMSFPIEVAYEMIREIIQGPWFSGDHNVPRDATPSAFTNGEYNYNHQNSRMEL